MSKFLNGLIEKFKIGRGDKVYKYTDLFPNTYKMMQIGEVMDELVKLGFERITSRCEVEDGGYIFVDELISVKEYEYDDGYSEENILGKIAITFHADRCIISIDYIQICALPHLKTLDKIKELINE